MDTNKLNKMVEFKGYELLFYVNENGNYTVRVLGDAEATEKLLAACKHKSVKPDRLHFFIKGIKGKIAAGVLPDKKKKANTQDPLVRLNAFCQKLWQRDFRAQPVKKGYWYIVGTEKVEVILPNGISVAAVGENKEQAKRIAARIMLKMIEEDAHYSKYL